MQCIETNNLDKRELEKKKFCLAGDATWWEMARWAEESCDRRPTPIEISVSRSTSTSGPSG